MAYLEEFSSIINTATNMLVQNDNVCKLLTYYPKEIDFRYNPLAQPVVQNPSDLILDKIFPLPKAPDIKTEQICFVDVTVAGDNVLSDNGGFMNVVLVFDVICHLDSWIIKGGYRPLKVMSEIDRMLNNKLTNLPISNKPVALPPVPKNYANKFYGYQMAYRLTVNSNIKCLDDE